MGDYPMVSSDTPRFRYRTVWLSDVHLGTRQCQAELLLDFLRHLECDTLFLVGDIVDIEALRTRWHWLEAHNTVVQKLLRLSRKGTQVFYILGNHDIPLANILDEDDGYCYLGGIRIEERHIYRLADGRDALVLHGHQFDGAIRTMVWLYILGDRAYSVALWLNRLFGWVWKRLGKPYWSLSGYLKKRVKGAVQFINNYEKLVVSEAESQGVSAVFAGHIHVPSIQHFGVIAYFNCGDWCESCSALVEDMEGTIRLVNHLHQPYAPV